MKKKPLKTGVTGIGPRIREWRKKIPMKSFILAELIKVSQGSLSDIENNKSDPSAKTLVSLLTITEKKGINLDWRWLLTGIYGDIPKGEPPQTEQPAMVINVSPGMEFIVKGTK